MTDSPAENTSSSDSDPVDPNAPDTSAKTELALPDDLPPVEPPSAGMIIQLFVVPALIVAIVVAVYTLFGQLASAELDWRQLVTDVKSENPHVRWRGALGLAQMLDLDAQRGEASQDLDSNPEIATALSELYQKQITVANPNEEETKQIEFLSKAMGRMDVQDVLIPTFLDGMKKENDREIRKHSMIGLAMSLGKIHQAGDAVTVDGLLDEIILTSQESDSLFRHQAAYILGLIDDKQATQRLLILLDDSDPMTRLNAAIAFARNDSLEGINVFRSLIRDATQWKLDPTKVKTKPDEEEYFERVLMLKNSMKALEQLESKFDGETATALSKELNAFIESTNDAPLRTAAKQIMLKLQNN